MGDAQPIKQRKYEHKFDSIHISNIFNVCKIKALSADIIHDQPVDGMGAFNLMWRWTHSYITRERQSSNKRIQPTRANTPWHHWPSKQYQTCRVDNSRQQKHHYRLGRWFCQQIWRCNQRWWWSIWWSKEWRWIRWYSLYWTMGHRSI